jgi:hypothetical protein
MVKAEQKGPGMNRMRFLRWVALPAVAGWMAGCTTAAPALTKAPPVTVQNDRALMMKFGGSMEKLRMAGKLVPLEKLQTGLTRTRCRVALPAGSSAGPLSAAEVYRSAYPSVTVHLSSYKCGRCPNWHVNASTCYPITADGVFVANYHAFKEKKLDVAGMAVGTADGRAYPVMEILAADAGADVCIFRVDLGGDRMRPIILGGDEPVGSSVYVLSHPTGSFFMFTEGVISRYSMEPTNRNGTGIDFNARMLITADYAKGSSGGPVLTARGELAGMVSATRSIYYDQHNGEPSNLQMVVKSCVPVRSIRAMIEP